MNRRILTSISPSHVNRDAQRIAVGSWVNHGYLPTSFNAPEEVDALRGEYPGADFVAAHRNGSGLYRAPYAMISAMIDYAKGAHLDEAMLVNSDIEIRDPDGLLSIYAERAKNGLVMANRYDHNGDGANPTRYEQGFDAFIINRAFFGALPQSLFVMGQTWWDYWIPHRFIKSGHTVETVKEPIFMHHRHQVQYDQKEWERMTEHFAWVEKYPTRGQAMSGRLAQAITNDVYRSIRKHAK